MNYGKAIVMTVFGFLSSKLGILFVPVMLMVACNVLDYITGLLAVPKRSGEKGKISSYLSMEGIVKKITMWLLVVVGAIMDKLLLYACMVMGYQVNLTFLIACVVAVWIVCNELISILENMVDIGITIPRFLLPIVNNLKNSIDNIELEKNEK